MILSIAYARLNMRSTGPGSQEPSDPGEKAQFHMARILAITKVMTSKPYQEMKRQLESAAKEDEQYKEQLELLVQHGVVIKVRTDVDGRYGVQGLPRGEYYVLARLTVFDKSLCWLVPVTVGFRQRKVDLSNSNAGCPFERSFRSTSG